MSQFVETKDEVKNFPTDNFKIIVGKILDEKTGELAARYNVSAESGENGRISLQVDFLTPESFTEDAVSGIITTCKKEI